MQTEASRATLQVSFRNANKKEQAEEPEIRESKHKVSQWITQALLASHSRAVRNLQTDVPTASAPQATLRRSVSLTDLPSTGGR